MEKLGFKKHWIDTIVNHIFAVKHLCNEYYNNILHRADDVPDARTYQEDPVRALQEPKMSLEQRRAVDAATLRLTQLANAKAEWDEDKAEELFDDIAEHSTMLFLAGPPGTGKTYTADLCIQIAMENNLTIAFALPTGQQASRMRKKYPGNLHLHLLCISVRFCAMCHYDVVDYSLNLASRYVDRHSCGYASLSSATSRSSPSTG